MKLRGHKLCYGVCILNFETKKTECLVQERVRGLLPLRHKAELSHNNAAKELNNKNNHAARETIIKTMHLGLADPVR